jgi:septal ring-binding cell division protein DamX
MKQFEEGTEGSAASVRRVGLILAGVVLGAVAVFSLGVMVGQRVTESVPSLGEPPPSVPMETLVPPTAPAPEKKVAAEGTAPSGDKLTFFDTLSGEKASPPPSLPKTPPPKSAPAAAPTPAAKPAPAPAAKPAAASPAERVNALRSSGSWYVQVASTTSSQGANDLVARLKKKGVKAVSTPVTLKGKQWYRVRIGTFPDKNSANQARKILKQNMKIDGLVMGG